MILAIVRVEVPLDIRLALRSQPRGQDEYLAPLGRHEFRIEKTRLGDHRKARLHARCLVSQLKKISLRRSYDQRRAQITQDLQLFGGGSDKIVDLEQRGLLAPGHLKKALAILALANAENIDVARVLIRRRRHLGGFRLHDALVLRGSFLLHHRRSPLGMVMGFGVPINSCIVFVVAETSAYVPG